VPSSLKAHISTWVVVPASKRHTIVSSALPAMSVSSLCRLVLVAAVLVLLAIDPSAYGAAAAGNFAARRFTKLQRQRAETALEATIASDAARADPASATYSFLSTVAGVPYTPDALGAAASTIEHLNVDQLRDIASNIGAENGDLYARGRLRAQQVRDMWAPQIRGAPNAETRRAHIDSMNGEVREAAKVTNADVRAFVARHGAPAQRIGDSVSNGFTYTLDQQSRVSAAEGYVAVNDLQDTAAEAVATNFCKLVYATQTGGQVMDTGNAPLQWNTGHIIASSLGGSNNDLRNFFPQRKNSNDRPGAFYYAEDFARALRRARLDANDANAVWVRVTLTYTNAESLIPTAGKYMVSWKPDRLNHENGNYVATLAPDRFRVEAGIKAAVERAVNWEGHAGWKLATFDWTNQAP